MKKPDYWTDERRIVDAEAKKSHDWDDLQVQYIDKIVDAPVQKQRQVPMVQKVQKTVEIPQVEYIDRVVDLSVQKQRQVPMIQKVHKTVEVLQIQYIERIVEKTREAEAGANDPEGAEDGRGSSEPVH